MRIKQMYSPDIAEWSLKPDDVFLGRTELITNYGLGLTPPDPTDLIHSYFTIQPTFIIRHESNGDVFTYSCKTVFQIENNKIKPTPEFLFDVVNQSVLVSNSIMADKSKNTIVGRKSIPAPDYYHLYPDLIQAILLAYPD